MELWILLALAAGGIACGAAARVFTSHRRAPVKDAKNIYPLW